MTDDSADHTVPRNFVAWNARPPTQSAAAMEAGNIPVYRPPAMDQQPAAPPPVRVPRRATTGKRPTITDSPPHSVTIALDRGAVVSMPPPEPVTTRRTSTRRANKRAKGPVVEKPTPTASVQPSAAPTSAPQTPNKPVIRTLLSTTTAQDDDDESDSEDALLGSADRSPHVRFSTPISTQLDELAAADNEASSPPPVPQVLRSTVKPTFEPPKPVVVSDADFVANMTKRSSARPRRIDGVEIMPDRFAAFQSDSAEEFFEANKPPWAPRIAARALNNARKWKTLEIYDNFDLKQLDWYAFIEEVAGLTDVDDVSEYAQTLTYGDRTGLIAPTRVGDRPGIVGAVGAAATASGAGIIDPAVAGMMSPDVRPAPTVSIDGAPSGLFAGTGGGRGAPVSRTTMSSFDTDEPHGFPTDFTTMMSTGRLAPERQELLKKLHAAEFLDLDTPEDRNRRRQERLDMVRALPYINRPLATGVFLLNPKYIAALNAAYTKIQVYAGPDTTLRNVPRSEFMRRRSRRETGGDTASDSVRQTFAELVACYIFLAHDSRHRGNQFKSDRQANEDRANELLRLLRNRFGYNHQSRVFYDVTPANDERYQARCAQFSHRGMGASAPFNTVFPVQGTVLPGYLFPVGPAAYRPL